MALNNANLLQDNIDLSIDLNILKDANNKYLLDALANLGQRMGVSGDSITISNLNLSNWLETLYSDVYLTIKYDDSEQPVIRWYDPSTTIYTDANDQLTSYSYNKLTYDKLNDILTSYNGIINDVINFNDNSYAHIDNDYLDSYLFSETLRDDTHYMYEHVKYNLNTSVVDEYYRLLYLGNYNNANVYVYVTLINGLFDLYIFNDIYSDTTVITDILNKTAIDSAESVANLITNINYYIKCFTNNNNNVIFSTKTNGSISLTLSTEHNINYIINEEYTNYVNNIYSMYLKDYDIKVTDFILYINNYISYLCPDIIKNISYRLYTQSIKVFTKQILINLYEAVVDSVDPSYKIYGELYLPYNLVIPYISKSSNAMYPFSSSDIQVYFTTEDIEEYEYKIIFKYDLTNIDTISYDITDKIKVFKFYCKYNEYNESLYNVYFVNNVLPYIGSNNLWYINDTQTDVLASYDNNNSINISVVEYNLDSSYSAIDDISKVQLYHDIIKIIDTSTNEYEIYKYNNVNFQIPLLSINMYSVNENILFIGKANIQTTNVFSIYFIYVCTHINGEIYQLSPLINSNGDLITINELVNYEETNISAIKNNIEELGFNNNIHIDESIYFQKSSNNVNVYYQDDQNYIDTDSKQYITYTNTSVNITSTEIDSTYQTYDGSDSTASTNYVNSSSASVNYNNYIAYSQWKLNNNLFNTTNLLFDNIKTQNRISVVSINESSTYLDYFGQNIVKNYNDEMIITGITPNEYNTQVFDKGLLSVSDTHDTIRIKYNDIIANGNLYTSNFDNDNLYIRNINYYTAKINVCGNIDFYCPNDSNAAFKTESETTPQALLGKLFSTEVMQVRNAEGNKTSASFIYVYNYQVSSISHYTQTIHVFMNVSNIYEKYNIDDIQNVVINGHYYNVKNNVTHFNATDSKYAKNRYISYKPSIQTLRYIYLGEYLETELYKLHLPSIPLDAICANFTYKMDDNEYSNLTSMYFNSNVQMTIMKYVTDKLNSDTTISDVYFDFNDNENS